MSWKIPENRRIRDKRFGVKGEPHGAFAFDSPERNFKLLVIASNSEGWEHASARAIKHLTPNNCIERIPSWNEMCFVKAQFWDDEDIVMQLHPKKSEYVNNHPCVLHLWRPIGIEIPTPPSILVGLKEFK